MRIFGRVVVSGLWGMVGALAIAAAAQAGTITYSYDSLGRLTSVVYSDGHSITYAYDAAGNRTVVAVH